MVRQSFFTINCQFKTNHQSSFLHMYVCMVSAHLNWISYTQLYLMFVWNKSIPIDYYHICFIVGMLSKSTGHVLWVSAVFYVLISLDTEVSETAVTAAANFVMVCCQQMALIAGGLLSEEVKRCKSGTFHVIVCAIIITVHCYSNCSSLLIYCVRARQRL